MNEVVNYMSDKGVVNKVDVLRSLELKLKRHPEYKVKFYYVELMNTWEMKLYKNNRVYGMGQNEDMRNVIRQLWGTHSCLLTGKKCDCKKEIYIDGKWVELTSDEIQGEKGDFMILD